MAIWTRFNTGLLILVLLGIIAVLAMRVEGGPLDPPGAPAPTDSVRLPGTPVTGPMTISQPGHYYLTRSFSAPSSNGITINAADVTLDLGGFTISGSGEASGTVGVQITGNRVTIMNGRIIEFQVGLAADGVAAMIRDIRVLNTRRGINLAAPRAVLRDCNVASATEVGILVYGARSVISRCVVAATSTAGIQLGLGGTGEFIVLEESTIIDANLSHSALAAGVVVQSSNTTVEDSVIGGKIHDIRNDGYGLFRVIRSTCIETQLVWGSWADLDSFCTQAPP